MKRIITVLVAMLILSGVALFADERTLIDFATLTKDVTIGSKGQNSPTIIQFSDRAESMNLTEEQQKEMVVSLALDQWEILLASSSKTVENMRLSNTKEVPSQKFKQVLGARIHFPTGYYNSWAIIRPPFEIPAYSRPTKMDNGAVTPLTDEEIAQANANLTAADEGYKTDNSKYEGFGVIKNVGVIKSISINVYGNNFPHGLGLRIKDERENIRDVFFGYLDFEGWRTLTWQNSSYIEDVRDRELRKIPLYPYATPHLKLMGVILYRDGSQVGSDFVVYFKDIKVTYDKAILTTERDIKDEEAWNILEEREAVRRAAEESRVGNIQMLRYIEDQKMHKDTTTSSKTTTTTPTTTAKPNN